MIRIDKKKCKIVCLILLVLVLSVGCATMSHVDRQTQIQMANSATGG